MGYILTIKGDTGPGTTQGTLGVATSDVLAGSDKAALLAYARALAGGVVPPDTMIAQPPLGSEVRYALVRSGNLAVSLLLGIRNPVGLVYRIVSSVGENGTLFRTQWDYVLYNPGRTPGTLFDEVVLTPETPAAPPILPTVAPTPTSTVRVRRDIDP